MTIKNRSLGRFKSKKHDKQLLLLLGLIIITTAMVLGIRSSNKYVIKQAENRIQDVLLEAEAMHYYVQREMHPAMYELKAKGYIPEGFYAPEMLSSSFITRRVFQQYNLIRADLNLPPVQYRMASANPRNLINLADSIELSILEQFNQDAELTKLTGSFEANGNSYFYYAKPFLRINKNCLKCHGKREDAPQALADYYHWESGFDLKIGQIPAIEVITTPLVAEKKTSTNIGLIIFFATILLEILLLISYRLFNKNTIINHQKEQIQDTLNKLKSTQASLLESDKMASLGILTAGVAHELNNPLNFINGAYIGLDSYFNKQEEQQKKEVKVLLNALKTGIDRSTEIILGLNQFSRNNADFSEPCQIEKIIDNCLLILQNQYKSRIEIHKTYQLPENVTILGNSGKLHQVFLNLITNALQAIEGNGSLNISTALNKDKINIHISDTGCGISKDDLHNIFDPFFTTKPPGEGTGLGLSITYNIIKEHHGKISFHSELGKGTTVEIVLPHTKI